MLTAEHAREQLAQADAHVAKTERQIADQVERIKRLEKLEADTRDAEELLRVLHDSLAVLQWHRKVIAEAVEAAEKARA